MKQSDIKHIPLPKGYSNQTGGAWRKGFIAAVSGKSERDCPYDIRRTTRNIYAGAWIKGWKAGKNKL